MRGSGPSSARRISANRESNTSTAIAPSSRASGAPRQKCVPIPNVRCRLAFARRMSKASAFGNTTSSRFADPNHSTASSPASMRVSPTTVAAFARRDMYCAGAL